MRFVIYRSEADQSALFGGSQWATTAIAEGFHSAEFKEGVIMALFNLTCDVCGAPGAQIRTPDDRNGWGVRCPAHAPTARFARIYAEILGRYPGNSARAEEERGRAAAIAAVNGACAPFGSLCKIEGIASAILQFVDGHWPAAEAIEKKIVEYNEVEFTSTVYFSRGEVTITTPTSGTKIQVGRRFARQNPPPRRDGYCVSVTFGEAGSSVRAEYILSRWNQISPIIDTEVEWVHHAGNRPPPARTTPR